MVDVLMINNQWFSSHLDIVGIYGFSFIQTSTSKIFRKSSNFKLLYSLAITMDLCMKIFYD